MWGRQTLLPLPGGLGGGGAGCSFLRCFLWVPLLPVLPRLSEVFSLDTAAAVADTRRSADLHAASDAQRSFLWARLPFTLLLPIPPPPLLLLTPYLLPTDTCSCCWSSTCCHWPPPLLFPTEPRGPPQGDSRFGCMQPHPLWTLARVWGLGCRRVCYHHHLGMQPPL